MTQTYKIGRHGFRVLPAATTRVEWKVAGGTIVVADRSYSGSWLILDGPASLVGRTFRNLRAARDACRAAAS